MGIGASALAVLKIVAERETASGLVTVADLIDATNLEPRVVVNELERLIRSGLVTGRLEKTMSGGDPRPWFLLNPLLSDRGAALLEQQRTQPDPEPGLTHSSVASADRHWDAFISHAHEDKTGFVRDLATELSRRDLAIWYDDEVLEVGDSVRNAIDEGLHRSDFGIVVISPDFMRKDWTNRELEGILALERGQKRLLPVWHRVGHEEVMAYSPTLAGRKAAQSAFGVQAVADALCRAMKRGTIATTPATGCAELEPGPTFMAQLGQMANARVYALVVIGTEFERPTPLTDDEIDIFATWLASLEPRATMRQANSGFIWMTLLGDDLGSALWTAEVRPGPVVTLLTAMHVRELGANAGHAVAYDRLVGWWATVIGALPDMAMDLGIAQVRLGLGLYPYGSDSTRVVELDFTAAPRPKRRAAPHQIPPWSAQIPLFDPSRPPPDILNVPIRSLLDQFSYGRVEATQAWTADGLASGSLKAGYRGPADINPLSLR